MRTKLKRIAVLALGWLFLALGVVGLFLPILQGVLFLLIGLIILSSEYIWAHKLLTRILLRYPKLAAHVHQARRKGHEWKEKVSAWAVRVFSGKPRTST
ncbi:MAG TPA: PGPGW domain-containing protein [Terriglobales bacterium]|jgi:uncharacterized membrane protein YbaN (DUF454 family)|nr:PGPGW domain-containing protein [Terriglobales bacterium]